jgi:3-oxoacyl-[acyl-carrier protein] reductase
MISLNGQVALVTGASRGIGRAIALRLAQLGAKVVVNYNHSADAAQQVVEAIKQNGGEAVAVQGDVSKFDEAQKVVKATLEAFGRLDILVNNAGTTRDNLLALMKEQDFDLVIATDLKSVFNMSKAALRPMMRQKSGRIVNITSVAGITGNPGQTNYSAAKAGIIGFTKAMAKEYGIRGIAVNAVAPGFVPTDLTNPLPQAAKDALLKLTALQRFGTCEEVADAVAFLASGNAAYITGQVLAVDGGIV